MWKLESERGGSDGGGDGGGGDGAPGNERDAAGEGGCLGVFLFVE